MRKIVVRLFMSLDGVIEGPGSGDSFALAGWADPYWEDAIRGLIFENMVKSDGLLLGRVTYQGFEAAFSSQTHEMAEAINNYPKYVVSSTLEKTTWANSTLLKSVDEVSRLKQQPGKDLFVNGSGTLAASLMRHNLIKANLANRNVGGS